MLLTADFKHKILLVKEEADSSQVNQAYDRLVAKNDKKSGRAVLEMLRNAKSIDSGIINQWGLVHVGLHMLRACPAQAWISSFQACNLLLKTRVPFSDWCAKISSDMMAGDTFKAPEEDETYDLMPAVWKSLSPEERTNVITVFEEHGRAYTPEAVAAIHTK